MSVFELIIHEQLATGTAVAALTAGIFPSEPAVNPANSLIVYTVIGTEQDVTNTAPSSLINSTFHV